MKKKILFILFISGCFLTGSNAQSIAVKSNLLYDATPRVINQQLKELEIHGMIQKKIFSELPPHTEYSITEQGRTLLPIIEQLEKWGDGFRPQMKKILGMED